MTENQYTKGELAKKILKHLALGGAVIVCTAVPGMAQVLKMFAPKNRYERNKIGRSFRNLKRQKIVKIYVKNDKEVIEITERGKMRLLQYQFEDMKIKRPKPWDGRWRMIMFDIPVKKDRARKLLRLKLNELGFRQYQKSVFVAPFECKKEIDFIAHYLSLEKFIKYIAADYLDGQEILKKSFKL